MIHPVCFYPCVIPVVLTVIVCSTILLRDSTIQHAMHYFILIMYVLSFNLLMGFHLWKKKKKKLKIKLSWQPDDQLQQTCKDLLKAIFIGTEDSAHRFTKKTLFERIRSEFSRFSVLVPKLRPEDEAKCEVAFIGMRNKMQWQRNERKLLKISQWKSKKKKNFLREWHYVK